MKTTIKLVMLLGMLFCAFSALAQSAQTETPAERRVKELVQFLNTGNRAAYQKYVTENFAPNFARIPMERHLGFFSELQDSTRGVEFHGIQDTKPNEATARLKTKLTGGWLAVLVRVEAEAPHRITGIGTRPAKPLPDAAPAKALSKEQMARELETFMKKLADADVFSGTVLLAKDGVPVFKGAYGMANKDFNVPNRIDTKFNLGSMNKMFTAVAIAQLVERGKLSFDDPLAKFLPDFPNKEDAEKIKIKHLLTHTAGLGGYFSPKWQQSSRAEYRTVDDMMKRVIEDEKKVQFEPGSRWQYSNSGMLVLGKVIEVASGQNYFDYVRDNIAKPAGMTNTDCYELDKVNPNLAVGYQKEFSDKGVSFSNNIFMHVMRGGPQGGGYSTVEDLLKFDVALRSNKLVGAEYVKMLLSAKPDLKSPQYGYGFQVSNRDGVVIAGHGGGFAGISSNLDMFLGTGWTAIVMSNYGNGSPQPEEKMRELVLPTIEAKTAQR
ncbi:MAG TPA: serine hydrolase domain-containing protein [Blastocatellia bacterium]|nr:serine hydrolase domain-containing protein [Blastocatellia bacterium]